jgi:hypothetical protein
VARRGRWVAIAVGVVVAGPPAWAQQAPAEQHYQRGMALYARRDFAAAARELATAYLLDPRREILFAQAQATRLAGDCPHALPLYQQFLATAPPAQQVEATRIAMTRCQPPSRPTLPAARTLIVRDLPPPPPFYRDWKAGALTGGGLLAAATGLALMSSAAALDREAGVQDQLEDFASRHDRARTRWRAGLVTTALGGALVAAGLGRYLWIATDGTRLSAGARF